MSHPMTEPVQSYTDLWLQKQQLTAHDGFRHERWCTGHGWLLSSGVLDVVGPLLVGEDDYFHFAEVDASAAEKLLELLPNDYLANERQNEGPTIGCILRALVAHPDRLLAHGYVIGAGRCDERLTMEGVLVCSPHNYLLCPPYGPQLDQCECDQLWQSLIADFGIEDSNTPPDELERWPRAGASDGFWYRAWWD